MIDRLPELEQVDNGIANPGLKQASLVEGVLSFVNLFASGSEEVPLVIEGHSMSIHLKKIEEPAYWMSISSTSGTSSSNSQSLIQNIYDAFYLLNGSMEHIYTLKGQEALQDTLSRFFAWFLTPTLAMIPILGIRYLSLDSSKFMKLQSFVSHVTFSSLSSKKIDVCLLQSDHLVSSSLPLKETRQLYSYLTQIVCREAICSEVSTVKERSYWFKKKQVLYIPDRRFMSIFRTVNGATLALIHDENFELDLVTPFCTSELYNLSTPNNGQLSDPSHLVTDPSVSYVYVNSSNCALKASPNSASSSNPALEAFEQDIELLTKDDKGSKSVSLQLLAKNEDDLWLAAQRAEERTLYSTFEQS
ncbi:Vacuolar fusion protein CCZ1 -like protein [Halotydeus destructor]|nr:Vacuolar fusion protein CCZ1 -like protein [Halotydeus destructor]